jgi:hypothetical protein
MHPTGGWPGTQSSRVRGKDARRIADPSRDFPILADNPVVQMTGDHTRDRDLVIDDPANPPVNDIEN